MNAYRPTYTAAQLDAGRRIAEAALARGYGHNAARAIARTYVDHTPTLKETRDHA
jgi:hypothetical protein